MAVAKALVSIIRGLPFLFTRRPRTPLRVLCLMAFDLVHVLRKSTRLPWCRMRTVALLLDFGACLNDHFDNGGFSSPEFRTTRSLLERSQYSIPINDYVKQLRNLEEGRPTPGGRILQYGKARAYRESVVRLSLATVAATAFDDVTIDDGIRATRDEDDLQTLFRIVMLCQIIDDVVDLGRDIELGLPGFLTSCASPSRAFALTSVAAKQYADRNSLPCTASMFPLRLALMATAALAQLALIIGHWRLK